MRSTNIGRMGETTVANWAAEQSMTANESVQDDQGWDLFIELPHTPESKLRDIHEGAYECKVQVKATDSEAPKVAIKLSNLRKQASSQLPGFILLLQFGGKADVQSAYVRHIDEELIEKILKRVSTIESEGKALNKSKMTISFDDRNKLPANNGLAFKVRILSDIGGSMNEYSKKKNAFLERCGYDEVTTKIQFSLAESCDIGQLYDSSIGIDHDVEVENVMISHRRFGIDSKPIELSPASQLSTLKFSNVKPSDTGSVTLSAPSLNGRLTFPVGYFKSSMFDHVAEELKKIRITCDFFECSVFFAAKQSNFEFEQLDKLKLNYRELYRRLSFVNYALGNCGKGYITFSCGEESLLKLDLVEHLTTDDLSDEVKYAQSAIRLLSILDMVEEPVSTISELIDDGRSIKNILALLEGKAKITIDIEYSESMEKDDFRSTQLQFFQFFMGSHTVIALVSLRGKSTRVKGSSFHTVIDSSSVENVFSFTRGENALLDEANQFKADLADKLSETENVFTGPDMPS